MMKTVVRCWSVMALLLAVFVPAPVQAAASDYTFTVSLGAYDDISDEAGYTALTVADLDDGAANIALPYTFTYDGVSYNTGRISVNGWLEMGQTYTGFGYTNALDSIEAKPLLAPLWDDLYLPTEGQIGYATLGAAPNRVFVVQWVNVLWSLTNGTPQNFQVRLHETTNIIEFIYGTMNAPGGSPSASIGINDATSGSGHFLSVTPAAGTADTVSSTTANNSINSAVNLPSGKTYTFTPLDSTAPPACAINVSPVNGATDVMLNAALEWSAGSGQVDGYRLYFGTDNPPTNLINGTDLGNVTTYDPVGDLATNTTYYWQAVPYNTHGDATGCPVWSFTTGASISTDLLNESFTGTDFPPTGWTIPTAGACAWSRVTSGSYPTQSPYSAPAEAQFNSYSCPNGNYKQLLSPELDFSAAGEYSLIFWMYHDTLYANTSPDRLQVQVSLDGGSTFENVGAEISRFTGMNGWAQHTLDLSAYVGQDSVRVVFKGISGWGSNMFLDDVSVVQTVAASRPNCALLPVPSNGATGVPLAANLSWANGGGVPAGYKISFGVDNPPTSIVQNVDLGKVTTYDPAAAMAAETTHTWQIVPYNSFGDAENCPVWSFTTGSAPLSVFPYVEGFEGGAGGWTSGGANSSWALGTPAGAVIQGASTGSNAWTTGLTTAYNLNEQSYVQSPAFDFSGLMHPYLKFDLWWDAEEDYDGANLQASLDGENWDIIGECCTGEANWYGFYPAGLDDSEGWSGDTATDDANTTYNASRGWRTAILNASDLADEPYVLLRFYFGEDGATVSGDGFAFDNFEIRPGCAWTGGVDETWHTAGNWDCGHVPGADEIAMIPWFFGDPVPYPVISTNASVSAVRADGTLTLAGGNLTTRYIYEYDVINIAEGNEVILTGSGNAWEVTWETQAEWTNSNNGLVRFSGPGVQRIVHDYWTWIDESHFLPGERAQFYNLVIENGAQVQSAGNLQVVNDLTVNQGGSLEMGEFGPEVNHTLTNNGTLRQGKTLGAVSYDAAFFDTGGYGGLKLNPSGWSLGATTVQIRGNQDCTSLPDETVKRCFNITPSTSPGDPGVMLTFYFAASEIPVGQTCDSMQAYHWNGDAWDVLTLDINYDGDGRACTVEPYSVRVTGAAGFSPFVLSNNAPQGHPTAVTLARFEATPQSGAIRVTWETAQELENLGFNLYRGENVAGPWQQLNAALIPSQAPGAVFGAVYEWLDTEVQAGLTYYYLLEEVDIHGRSTFHGPVSVVATDPAAVTLERFVARSPVCWWFTGIMGLFTLAGMSRARRRSWNG